MNRKQFITSIIMTAMMAAFIVFSPKYIMSSRTLRTLQRTEENQEGYHGIISIWHIVKFKPYQGSLGSWVSDVAARLEKLHSGVYLEVESITLEEYSARIARGEQPDVFSYPLGCTYAEQLKELKIELPALRGNLDGSGCHNGRLYGVPYTMSGYLLVHNQRLMQENGQDAEGLASALKSGNYMAAGDPAQACILGIKGELLNEDDFLMEKAMSAFMDARAAGDLERKVQSGKGFPFETAACSNYSDLVQLLGVNINTQAEKMPYIYEFIMLCLDRDNQQELMDMGLMPAILDVEIKKSESESLNQLFAKLDEPAVPNSYLYEIYSEQLKNSALEAMRGSASAKKDFDLRLTELVRGATIK